jgi:hypothetical protein
MLILLRPCDSRNFKLSPLCRAIGEGNMAAWAESAKVSKLGEIKIEWTY